MMTINATLFYCIESNTTSNTNNTNNTNINEEIDIIDDCSTYIGFGSKIGVNAIRSLSIIGFTLNFAFLIFQNLRLRRKKKKIEEKIQ